MQKNKRIIQDDFAQEQLLLHLAQFTGRTVEAVREEIAYIKTSSELQKKEWIDKLRPLVSRYLHQLATATWGENRYTFVEDEDSATSNSWYVIRQQGEKFYFQVTLRFPPPPDTLSHIRSRFHDFSGEELAIKPIGFLVGAKQNISCGFAQNYLKEAMTFAYRVGPKSDGLNSRVAQALADCPYKKGEYDKGILPLLCLISTCFLGLYLLFIKGYFIANSLGIVIGLLLIALAIGSLIMTQFGRRYNRFKGRKSYFVLGSMLPGGLVFLIFGGIILLVVAGCFIFIYSQAAKEVVPVVVLNDEHK